MSTERTWEQRGLRQYAHAPGVEWWREAAKDGEWVDDKVAAEAFGRRSDGQNFFIGVRLSLTEYADEEHRAAALKKAFDVLDTFIDPRCECDFPQVCEWHKTKAYLQG